jgi:hypothetical protein
VNPTIEEIEALADRLLERIETVREDGAPGLESRVLRLETDGIQATYGNDYYILLDEETLPRYGEADDAVDTRAEEYAEDGVTSQYVVDQTVYGADDQRLQWAVRLRQFDRARDAGDWLSILPERAEDGWLTGGAEIDDLEIEEIDDLGDGAVLFTGTVVGDDLGIAMLFVQSGELVTMVGVYSAIGVFDADALIELAGEQLDCVDDGGCDMAYPIPDEMLEFVEGRG